MPGGEEERALHRALHSMRLTADLPATAGPTVSHADDADGAAAAVNASADGAAARAARLRSTVSELRERGVLGDDHEESIHALVEAYPSPSPSPSP